MPADVVIVDESSMVPLALMSHLMAATPDHARVILLGDRDQLASVEAGAIFGDLCNDGRGIPGYSEPASAAIESLGGEPPPDYPTTPPREGVWDHIVELVESHRFRHGGALHRLATAVNGGDAAAAVAALHDRDDPGGSGEIVRWHDAPSGPSIPSLVEDVLGARLGAFLEADDPVAALEEIERFRILCAHRGGPLGTDRVNRAVREALARDGRIADGEWYAHRPVMITRNDYQLELFNGDVGVALNTDLGLRVFFPPTHGDAPRSLHPARLPEHETVFAMTIHKSQGSEFDHVLMLLPAVDSPILTRELIYTGATRARRRLDLAGATAVLENAIARRIRRPSGLRDALYGDVGRPEDPPARRPAPPARRGKPTQGTLFDDLGA